MQMSKFALNLVQYVFVEVVLSETFMIGKGKKAILDYRESDGFMVLRWHWHWPASSSDTRGPFTVAILGVVEDPIIHE